MNAFTIVPVALLAFHCGWWGRHRLTTKIKAQALKAIADAHVSGASPDMLVKIRQAYWNML